MTDIAEWFERAQKAQAAVDALGAGRISPDDARDVLGVLGESGGWETGGFKRKLIEAMFSADAWNLDRLAQVFPGLTAAVRLYKSNDDGVATLRGIAA